MIKVNGSQMELSDISVTELLSQEKYDIKRIAVEVNGQIVPKTQYESFMLKDGDNIEIVSFVGGG